MNRVIFSLIAIIIFSLISCNKESNPFGYDDYHRNDDTIGKKSSDDNIQMIAYWNFDDESAQDQSGNGYHGRLVNQDLISYVDGSKGLGVHLTGKGNNQGEGGYIRIPMIDFTKYDNFTIEMDVYEEGMSYEHGNAFISFGDWNYGSIIMGHIINPQHSFFEKMIVMGYMHFDDVTNTKLNTPLITHFQPSINKWNHYKLEYINHTFYIYINGKFLGEKIQRIEIEGIHAAIGAHFWNDGKAIASRFTGIIDEVKIYTKKDIARDK